MNQFQVICSIFIVSILCQVASAAPGLRSRRAGYEFDEQSAIDESDLNPVELEEISGDGLDREKRKISPEASFATKNAILGFVFGASQGSAGAASGASKRQTVTTLPGKPAGSEDIPEFDRNKVSLDVPDELFANSINTVTSISKTVGNFIMNSARRYAQIIHIFQPLVGPNLTVKGMDAPPPTTTEADNFN